MKPHFSNLQVAASLLCLTGLISLSTAQSTPQAAPTQVTPWELQNSTTKAGLRGIHTVGNGVAWASGTNGTILRTEDGGYMWQSCAMPPGAEKLDFRGIWAWDANIAVAMSSGTGDLSRLYKTTNGCSSWKLLFTNPDKDGFWDALVFWDRNRGFLLGDPVSRPPPGTLVTKPETPKEFALFSTNDGGEGWVSAERTTLQTLENAAVFAASNSALGLLPFDQKRNWAYFGTGGASSKPFAYRLISHVVPPNASTSITELAWVHDPVPLASGNDSSGVFSLAFRDQDHGIAVGGDYKKPNEPTGTGAWTADGGKTWTTATKPPHGYRSAVAWDAADKAWIAVGTNGSDISYDDGKTWQPLDNGNWNALSLPWAVGPEGRIAKLVSLKGAAPNSR